MDALLTDLYQLTMLQVYLRDGLRGEAVFELFVRRLPAERRFLVAAGLEQALEYLEQLRFGAEEIDWLARQRRWSPQLLEHLAGMRFDGDVDAMPEGTIFFADEPILRVRASLPVAQWVESRLLNIVHLQTLIASKAARIVIAAGGRQLVDFGMRRAHGAEAAVMAARAAWLAGFDATATVEAGRRFGIPLSGTMSHAFVQVHEHEADAFERFARAWPEGSTLLVDTYDTEEAVRRIVRLAPRLAADGVRIGAVRLDSGDLQAHARRVRALLDEGGLQAVKVFASGNLDEHRIGRLVGAGAPIDGFGVGTALDTSSDAPGLDAVYKLQCYAGRPCRKRSEGKATWPGEKQVCRRLQEDGQLQGDVLQAAGEPALGQPLLQPCMRGGRRVSCGPLLDEARALHARERATLPPPLRSLDDRDVPDPVEVSSVLRRMAAEFDARGT
jgi:nicotinate phosphoribosyltransferase